METFEVEPYDLGYQCGRKDQCPDCPFPDSVLEYDEWWAGYHDGFNNN